MKKEKIASEQKKRRTRIMTLIFTEWNYNFTYDIDGMSQCEIVAA